MKLSNAVIRWAKTLKDYDPNNETMRSFGEGIILILTKVLFGIKDLEKSLNTKKLF